MNILVLEYSEIFEINEKGVESEENNSEIDFTKDLEADNVRNH